MLELFFGDRLVGTIRRAQVTDAEFFVADGIGQPLIDYGIEVGGQHFTAVDGDAFLQAIATEMNGDYFRVKYESSQT